MIKTVSCKFTEEMVQQLEAEATRQETSVSHILRWAVEAYFQGEGARQQNMKTLLERIDRLEYEVVKNRVLSLYVHDPEGTLIKQKELDDAGENAMAYLEARTGRTKAA